jgi:hypothetical protein
MLLSLLGNLPSKQKLDRFWQMARRKNYSRIPPMAFCLGGLISKEDCISPTHIF